MGLNPPLHADCDCAGERSPLTLHETVSQLSASGVPITFDSFGAIFLGPGRLNQVDHDVDVTACGFGIRADLVRGVHDGLGHLAFQTRQADIETSTE